jgi:hypothetical protein
MRKNAQAVRSVENIVRRLARWSNMTNAPFEKGPAVYVKNSGGAIWAKS